MCTNIINNTNDLCKKDASVKCITEYIHFIVLLHDDRLLVGGKDVEI